jgi:RNA polymerase sigma-70 factor (ECF subfamily)
MDDRVTAPWLREYGSVYRFVRRRSASREDAEDVTQEVFVAAAAALARSRLDAEAPPLAWLYTVARRRLVDRLRAAPPESAALDPGALADEGHAYGPTLLEALVDGVRSLDEGQRRVVVMKVFEGRSFAEIAAEVGASEEACRMRFSRGLARLRSLLIEKGVTP